MRKFAKIGIIKPGTQQILGMKVFSPIHDFWACPDKMGNSYIGVMLWLYYNI
jgi:hypothetical protein